MEEVYISNKDTGIPEDCPTKEKQNEIIDKLNDITEINTTTQDSAGITNSLLGDIKMLVTLPQDLSVTASPTFTGATLSGLTPSRLVFTDVGGGLVSGITDITATQLEELSDGSETTLHSHASSGAMSYTDAGDIEASHYTHDDFTKNNQWHDLDLSGIVGEAQRLVLIEFGFEASSTGRFVIFRTKGYTNGYNEIYREIIVANKEHRFGVELLTDASGVIEYKFTNALYTSADMVIRGWKTV